MRLNLTELFYWPHTDHFDITVSDERGQTHKITLNLPSGRYIKSNHKPSKRLIDCCNALIKQLYSTADISIMKILKDCEVSTAKIYPVILDNSESAYILTNQEEYLFVKPTKRVRIIDEDTYWILSPVLNSRYTTEDKLSLLATALESGVKTAYALKECKVSLGHSEHSETA